MTQDEAAEYIRRAIESAIDKKIPPTQLSMSEAAEIVARKLLGERYRCEVTQSESRC